MGRFEPAISSESFDADDAVAGNCKLLLVGEVKFGPLTATSLQRDVDHVVGFQGGVRISTRAEKAAS